MHYNEVQYTIPRTTYLKYTVPQFVKALSGFSVAQPPTEPLLKILNHGSTRLGSLGNMLDFLTLSRPKYKKTTLSRPIPAPACGFTPCLKLSI